MASKRCTQCDTEVWGKDFDECEKFVCKSCKKEDERQRNVPFMIEALFDKITKMESEIQECKSGIAKLKKHFLPSEHPRQIPYEELSAREYEEILQTDKEDKACDAMVAEIRAENNNYWKKY